MFRGLSSLTNGAFSVFQIRKGGAFAVPYPSAPQEVRKKKPRIRVTLCDEIDERLRLGKPTIKIGKIIEE